MNNITRRLQQIYESQVANNADATHDMNQLTDDQFRKKYKCSKAEVRNHKTITDVTEATDGLTGAALVDHLTSICMSSWYGLVQKFSAKPDVYDIQPSQDHDKYKVMKMTPGKDVRGDVYETLVSMTTSLTDKLNSAFGTEVFEPRISRVEGNLETLVAFVANKGGVFQAKATNNGGDSTIFVTMPVEEELNRAFSAMTSTPVPQDDADPIDAQISDPAYAPDPVAGDPVPEGESGMDTGPEENEFEVSLEDEEENRFDYPRESFGGFSMTAKSVNEDLTKMSDEELDAEYEKADGHGRWGQGEEIFPGDRKRSNKRAQRIDAERLRRNGQPQRANKDLVRKPQKVKKESLNVSGEDTYSVTYMDASGEEFTTTVSARSDSDAKQKFLQATRGAQNVEISKQIPTTEGKRINKHGLDDHLAMMRAVENALNRDIEEEERIAGAIVGAEPKEHPFERGRKSKTHEIENANKAELIFHIGGENWMQIQANYEPGNRNMWVIQYQAKNFDGTIVAQKKGIRVKNKDLYTGIHDAIDAIFKSGWKRVAKIDSRAQNFREAAKKRGFAVKEEVAANAVAPGGVDMAPDAGKKKKKPLRRRAEESFDFDSEEGRRRFPMRRYRRKRDET